MLLSITLLCFFSLLFVKVTLITDVIHVDISASSLGDTIVVFRDPYLFSDDIVTGRQRVIFYSFHSKGMIQI